MKTKSLEVGDVVVIVWHAAAVYKDTPEYYKPGNVGHPGVRRLVVGIVVTNEDGWLRLAKELSYLREGEDKSTVTIKNTYFELPWSWIDKIYKKGSVKKLLEDVWEKASV